jgi:hypothetical protein
VIPDCSIHIKGKSIIGIYATGSNAFGHGSSPRSLIRGWSLDGMVMQKSQKLVGDPGHVWLSAEKNDLDQKKKDTCAWFYELG